MGLTKIIVLIFMHRPRGQCSDKTPVAMMHHTKKTNKENVMETKRDQRIEWINANADKIIAARKANSDHSACKGDCHNGATCKAQSGGGWGYWARAFALTSIACNPRPYWSGSKPTPSTSINKGIADYIRANAPESIR